MAEENAAVLSNEQKGETAAMDITSQKKKALSDLQVPNWVVYAVIGVFLLVGIGWFFISGRTPATTAPASMGVQYADQASPQAVPVEILPQAIRNFGNGDAANPFATDVLGPIRLVGTVVNSNGKSTAIISTNGASLIVSIGDIMMDSSWEVSKITANSITFTSNGNDRTIYVDGIQNSSEAR